LASAAIENANTVATARSAVFIMAWFFFPDVGLRSRLPFYLAIRASVYIRFSLARRRKARGTHFDVSKADYLNAKYDLRETSDASKTQTYDVTMHRRLAGDRFRPQAACESPRPAKSTCHPTAIRQPRQRHSPPRLAGRSEKKQRRQIQIGPDAATAATRVAGNAIAAFNSVAL
jgi:hypothetical protein